MPLTLLKAVRDNLMPCAPFTDTPTKKKGFVRSLYSALKTRFTRTKTDGENQAEPKCDRCAAREAMDAQKQTDSDFLSNSPPPFDLAASERGPFAEKNIPDAESAQHFPLKPNYLLPMSKVYVHLFTLIKALSDEKTSYII